MRLKNCFGRARAGATSRGAGAVDRRVSLAYVPVFEFPLTNGKFGTAMLFTFLLVVQAMIAAALVGVILIQKSEGGGLGMGGSPSGLMSARGAADFLTRTTSILAAVFVGLSILLAVLAATRNATSRVEASAPASVPAAGAPAAPPVGGQGAAPFAPQKSAAELAAEAAAGNQSVPKADNSAAPSNGAVPLQR